MAERVVVAMSGGVDSSVCAALLQQQGYEVIGMTMKLWESPETSTASHKTCCTLDDVADARRVAAHLGIPFYVVNFKEQFSRHVIDYFVRSYQEGYTPNPCIHCNRYLKFTALRQRARQLGARWIATGHYASVCQQEDGRYYIRRGVDAGKDQSYFLFDLSQEQLAQTLLPLGAYHKEDVRQMAAQYALKVAAKAESQEICFIPNGDYRSFLKPRLEARVQAGDIVNTAGEVLGEHRGLPFYTVGQRHGLGIAAAHPLYVIQLEPERNVLRVGERCEATRTAFMIEGVNWMHSPHRQTIHTNVQIRYRHRPVAAEVQLLSETRAHVRLQEPQFAITPGQAAVFYEGDLVIGGGWIARSED